MFGSVGALMFAAGDYRTAVDTAGLLLARCRLQALLCLEDLRGRGLSGGHSGRSCQPNRCGLPLPIARTDHSKMRPDVQAFIADGPLPDWDAGAEEIGRRSDQFDAISRPVTGQEARALVACFGPDDAYGLGLMLWHLPRRLLCGHRAGRLFGKAIDSGGGTHLRELGRRALLRRVDCRGSCCTQVLYALNGR